MLTGRMFSLTEAAKDKYSYLKLSLNKKDSYILYSKC